ncbi:hypothetical protein Tco_1501431 [Tanacetum coccineum]
MSKFYNLYTFLVDFTDMALPPHGQRHQYLRVQVFDFRGLPDLMAERLTARMLMEHRDAQGVSLFTSRAWRRLFDIRGSLVHKLILEFFSTFRFGEAILDLDMPGALQFLLGGARRRLSWRQFILALGLPTTKEMETIGFDFLGKAPSYTSIRDIILRLCYRLIASNNARRIQAPEKVTMTDMFYLKGMDVDLVNVPYLLARYLRLSAAGRKSGALTFGGQFVARLAEHFGLLTEERLQGLTVIAPALPVIDTAELVRLQIFVEIDDTWAWAPPPPPAAARTMPERMARLEEDVYEIHGALAEQREVIGAMAKDFSRFTRKVRQRTGEANTSIAQQDPQIKPGSKFSIIVHEYVTEPSRLSTPKSRMEEARVISSDLVKEISMNIGGEFTNLEILKCRSLETSRRSDDEILPFNSWVPIRKSNFVLDLQKKQRNPIFQISMDIMQNTNFFRAFTASASVPAIYLDKDWFILDANLLREALEITPIDQAHQFVSPPSGDAIIDFVNELGYPGAVHFVSRMVVNHLYQPWRAILSMINQCLTGKTSGFGRLRYLVSQMLWGNTTCTNVDYAKLIWEEFKSHLSNAKTDESIGMKIPKELITDNIKNAPYYNAYLEMVAKHDKKIAVEEGGKKKSVSKAD